jgi:hypothetical protein
MKRTILALVLLIAGCARKQQHSYSELQPLLSNRCFLTKSSDEQQRLVREIDALPKAEFDKTMNDFDVVNASDRLLGTQGCENPR